MEGRKAMRETPKPPAAGRTAGDKAPAGTPEAPAGTETGREAPATPAKKPVRPDPTRYGDWEKGGRCIDF